MMTSESLGRRTMQDLLGRSGKGHKFAKSTVSPVFNPMKGNTATLTDCTAYDTAEAAQLAKEAYCGKAVT